MIQLHIMWEKYWGIRTETVGLQRAWGTRFLPSDLEEGAMNRLSPLPFSAVWNLVFSEGGSGDRIREERAGSGRVRESLTPHHTSR